MTGQTLTVTAPTTLTRPANVWQAKCTLGNETKLVQLSGISTYAELMHSVRAKFPNAGPFQLKFLDRCARSRLHVDITPSCQILQHFVLVGKI